MTPITVSLYTDGEDGDAPRRMELLWTVDTPVVRGIWLLFAGGS
jgi:hypothetical protein